MLAPLNFTLKQPLSLRGHANTYKTQTDAQYTAFHVFNKANSRNNDIRSSKQWSFTSFSQASVMVKQTQSKYIIKHTNSTSLRPRLPNHSSKNWRIITTDWKTTFKRNSAPIVAWKLKVNFKKLHIKRSPLNENLLQWHKKCYSTIPVDIMSIPAR